MPPTVPAPARLQTSGSAEAVARPEDAQERLTALWLTCPPRPRLCAGVPPPGAGKTSGWLPSRCAGRSRPPGSYESRARPAPPAVGGARPPWLRPRTAPGGRRTSPSRAPAPAPGTRQPGGGGGQRCAVGATLHPPGVSRNPWPRTRGFGDTSGARESQNQDGGFLAEPALASLLLSPAPRGCLLPRGVSFGAPGSTRGWATEMPRRSSWRERERGGGRAGYRAGARGLNGAFRSPPSPAAAQTLLPSLPRRAPRELLPAESSAEQGRPVSNLNSNSAPLGRPLSLLYLEGSKPRLGLLGAARPPGT